MTLGAGDIIRLLDLKPHPEGGHYRETWRADAALGERSAGTAIYYLLGEGEISHWHRIDAESDPAGTRETMLAALAVWTSDPAQTCQAGARQQR